MTFSESNLKNQITETDPWGDSSDIHQPKINNDHFKLFDGVPTEVVQLDSEKIVTPALQSKFTKEVYHKNVIKFVFPIDLITGKQVSITFDTSHVSEITVLQKLDGVDISNEDAFLYSIRLLPYSEKNAIKYEIVETKNLSRSLTNFFRGISRLKKSL